jgi:hypothetical protein
VLGSNAAAGSGIISSYQWNLDGSPIALATDATFTATEAGSYTVTVTNSNDCSVTSVHFTLTVNDLPTAAITGTASICSGLTSVLNSNATAGSGSISTYQWELDGSPIAGETEATFTATDPGSYTVTVTNSEGCEFTSAPFTLTVNALPTAAITGTASICSGLTSVLNSNATAGSGSITYYQWNLDGSPIAGETGATFTATDPGSYTVTVINSEGCEFTSASYTLTVNALPTATITGTASICSGESSLLNSNAVAGSGNISSYQWELDGSPIASATGDTFTATDPGSYTVTVINSEGCEFTSVPFTLTVNALPTAAITGTASICSGEFSVLNSNAVAGSGSITSYQWELDGSAIALATDATFTATEAGSYTVTVTNSEGCDFTSEAFILAVNALPTATIDGDNAICLGESSELNSNAMPGSGIISSYQWNIDGTPIALATDATFTATEAGS